MQDKVTFEYAIIRVVPKVEREEFFNVGAIVFSKRKKFLDVKFHIDPQKLELFCDELDIDMLNQYLKAWKAICEGGKEGGKIGELDLADRFRWLAASRSTVIQSSATHSGLTNDPQKELNDIFDKYVS